MWPQYWFQFFFSYLAASSFQMIQFLSSKKIQRGSWFGDQFIWIFFLFFSESFQQFENWRTYRLTYEQREKLKKKRKKRWFSLRTRSLLEIRNNFDGRQNRKLSLLYCYDTFTFLFSVFFGKKFFIHVSGENF